MKIKRILLSVFAFVSISANAQKGSWYVGGNVGFSSTQFKQETTSTTIDNGKNNAWSFSPELGTFFTDHLQLGLGLTLNGSKTNSQTNPINITKGKGYGANLYSRYFFGKEAFKPFLGMNVSAGSIKNKNTFLNNTSETESFNIGANINAGFGYAISKRVTTVGSLGFIGYNHSTNEATGSNVKNKSSSFGFDASTLGNRFNIGFYYTL